MFQSIHSRHSSLLKKGSILFLVIMILSPFILPIPDTDASPSLFSDEQIESLNLYNPISSQQAAPLFLTPVFLQNEFSFPDANALSFSQAIRIKRPVPAPSLVYLPPTVFPRSFFD